MCVCIFVYTYQQQNFKYWKLTVSTLFEFFAPQALRSCWNQHCHDKSLRNRNSILSKIRNDCQWNNILIACSSHLVGYIFFTAFLFVKIQQDIARKFRLGVVLPLILGCSTCGAIHRTNFEASLRLACYTLSSLPLGLLRRMRCSRRGEGRVTVGRHARPSGPEGSRMVFLRRS